MLANSGQGKRQNRTSYLRSGNSCRHTLPGKKSSMMTADSERWGLPLNLTNALEKKKNCNNRFAIDPSVMWPKWKFTNFRQGIN